MRLGQRSSGWPDYEVAAIIDARIAGKSEKEIRELVTRLIAARTIEQAPSVAVGAPR